MSLLPDVTVPTLPINPIQWLLGVLGAGPSAGQIQQARGESAAQAAQAGNPLSGVASTGAALAGNTLVLALVALGLIIAADYAPSFVNGLLVLILVGILLRNAGPISNALASKSATA